MLNEQESKKEVMIHLTTSGDVKSKVGGDLVGENTTMDELKAEMGTKKEAIQVHPMPGKFVAAAKQSGQVGKASTKGAGKKIVLIAIVLILVIIAGIAGVIFFVNRNIQTLESEQVVVEDQNTNQNTNINTNTNENQNTNININENINENINTNTNENQNTNININENINENIVQTGVDLDNDGLSGEEELLFSTNPDIEDTDKDGYKDGQEIVSLYNPLVPGQSLEDSGLVTKFVNNTYNYNILRPKTWLVRSLADFLDNILVLPDSENGESFMISVEDNSMGQTLNGALASRSKELGSAINYQNYSLAGIPALRSMDGKNVISIHGDYVYIIAHSVSPFGDINFSSVFEMMLNSFTWID